MPPKPFKPPRPGTASKSAAKGPRKSTGTAGKPSSAISKAKSKPGRPRISSPRPPHLPSLSPDPSASEASEHTQDDDQDAESESEHHNSDSSSSLPSQPSLPKNPPARRRKSHNASAQLDITSSDAHNNNNEEDAEAILAPRAEHIPGPLLSALLHTFLAEQGHAGTRIKKDANAAVGKYVDIFVREAIARAAWVRDEGDGGDGFDAGAGGRGGGGDRGFLEVEDLERLAPQLLMDF